MTPVRRGVSKCLVCAHTGIQICWKNTSKTKTEKPNYHCQALRKFIFLPKDKSEDSTTSTYTFLSFYKAALIPLYTSLRQQTLGKALLEIKFARDHSSIYELQFECAYGAKCTPVNLSQSGRESSNQDRWEGAVSLSLTAT